MRILLTIFLRQALTLWLQYFAVATLLIIFVGRIFGGTEIFLVLATYAGLFICFNQITQSIARNLNWILGLPISRRQILRFKYYYSLLLFGLFMLLSGAMVALTLKFAPMDLSNKLEKSLAVEMGVEQVTDALAQTQHPSLFMADFQSITLILCVLAFIHSVLLLIYHPENLRKTAIQYWSSWSPRERNIARSIVVGIVILYAVLTWLNSMFGFAAVALILGPTFVLWQSQRTLRYPVTLRRPGLLMTMTMGLAATLAIWTAGRNAWNSGNPDRQVEALSYFGDHMISVNRDQILAILKSDLKTEQLRFMVDYFKENFAPKRWVGTIPSTESSWDFESLLYTKKTYADIQRVLRLARSDTLPLPAVIYILEHAGIARWSDQISGELFPLVNIEHSPNELVKLLNSPNPLLRNYALLSARYVRSDLLIEPIRSLLRYPSDEVRLEALKSLSVLTGRYLGISEWNRLSGSPAVGLPSSLSPFDSTINCKELVVSSTETIKESEMNSLNVCIRDRAFKSSDWMERVEGSGWIQWPLTPQHKRLIMRIFKTKT